jgi:hypothetical protein
MIEPNEGDLILESIYINSTIVVNDDDEKFHEIIWLHQNQNSLLVSRRGSIKKIDSVWCKCDCINSFKSLSDASSYRDFLIANNLSSGSKRGRIASEVNFSAEDTFAKRNFLVARNFWSLFTESANFHPVPSFFIKCGINTRSKFEIVVYGEQSKTFSPPAFNINVSLLPRPILKFREKMIEVDNGLTRLKSDTWGTW